MQKTDADLTSEKQVIKTETDAGENSAIRIGTMIENLIDSKINNDKIDTDNALNTSGKTVPGRDAVKAYIAANSASVSNADETTKGIVEEATDAEVTAGTATGGTGAKLFVSPTKLATRLTTLLASYLLAADLDRTSVSVSGGTLTLDMNSKKQRRFYNSTTISSNFTLALSNTTGSEMWSLHINVTGTVAITMPSTFRMHHDEVDRGRWNTSTRILTIVGDTASPFELAASYDGAIWSLKATRKLV